ncbi:MAG: hypothetical protein EA378_10015 [Phycisphaerales bacterium]|nr:MAG: hypothetical protein EA378_10015 [Phycisphaerales bacterium]
MPAFCFGPTGCIAIHTPNPDFVATPAEIREEVRRLRNEPIELDRPVVVLSGYRAAHSMAARCASVLARLTSGDQGDTLAVSYTLTGDIERAAAIAVERVNRRWPSDDPTRTIEVDVVGISMGGLVARVAALPPSERPRANGNETGMRLNVRRVYTLGTPHRGALLAERLHPDRAARDMRAGSWFLEQLDATFEDRDYELIAYAHLRDGWVGAQNSAPPGMAPIWTGGTRLFSHFSISGSERILVDIARRLRGDPPLAEPGGEPPHH